MSDWVSFDPACVSQTGAITSFFATDGQYKITDNTVSMWARGAINVRGTGGGALIFNMPPAIRIPSGVTFSNQIVTPVRIQTGPGLSFAGTGHFVVSGSEDSDGYDMLLALKYDGTTPIANGNTVFVSAVYDIA